MKQVFITGADRGTGLALTEQFLSHGYRVYAGQYMARWQELEQLKQNYPDGLTLIPLDVSNTDSVKAAYEETRKYTDHLDILVNVAGIIQMLPAGDMAKQYSVNTVGAIRMVDVFLPLLKEGSRICFFSSEAGSVALSNRDDMELWLGYCSSKTMLNMAARLMFNRLSKEGIEFRLYHPGGVKSYIWGTDERDMSMPFEPEEAAKTAFLQFTTKRPYEDVLLLTDILDRVWAF